MAKKTFSTEDIINKLREAEVLTSQGKTMSEIYKALAISDQTYYRWRKEYGGDQPALIGPGNNMYWFESLVKNQALFVSIELKSPTCAFILIARSVAPNRQRTGHPVR